MMSGGMTQSFGSMGLIGGLIGLIFSLAIIIGIVILVVWAVKGLIRACCELSEKTNNGFDETLQHEDGKGQEM